MLDMIFTTLPFDSHSIAYTSSLGSSEQEHGAMCAKMTNLEHAFGGLVDSRSVLNEFDAVIMDGISWISPLFL